MSIVSHASGETVTRRQDREAVLLTAQDQITVTSYRLGPDQRGPAPHVHHRHTDAFYVLGGELSFILGPERERVAIGAGGLVAAPPNVVHTFNNESGAEVRFLNIHTPDGGFAEFMRAGVDGIEGVSFDTSDPPDDGGLPIGDAIVSRPGEGDRLVSGKRVALLKGVLPHICFAEFELDGPYDGPGIHQHDAEVDAFYVLEGELEMTVEDDRMIAEAGTLAAVPPGVRHTFNHRASGIVRFLNIHAPDGDFGAFLRRVSD